MQNHPVLSNRMKLLVIVLGMAMMGCAAPALIGRLVINPGDNHNTTSLSNAVVEPMLPDYQEDLAALAPNLPRYEIDLSVDFDALTFQGLSWVTYTNTESIPLDSLYFRLFPNGHKSYGDGSLTVENVWIGGQAVETRKSLTDSVLEVVLPEELGVGERTQIAFQFSGVVPREFGGGLYPTGYGIYNYSEEVMAISGWFPMLAVYDEDGWNLDPVSAIGDSVYSDTAFYDVQVLARKDLVLAGTGVEVSSQAEENMVRHHLVSGPVRDFFLIMSPDYECLSNTVDGVRVNSCYLPEHDVAGKNALAIAGNSLRVFNERFGSYPYGELDVMETPLRYASGVEYPTIVLISRDLYKERSNLYFSDVIAHEIAHQWWYGLVGNDVFDEPWLDEALAMYSDGLYREKAQGRLAYSAYIRFIQGVTDILAKEGNDDRITQSLGYFEKLNNPDLYSVIVYYKGALFFDGLRKEIGDDAFFQALQGYLLEYRYGVAKPEDLLRTFETTSGRSLSDFYHTWLYSPRK